MLFSNLSLCTSAATIFEHQNAKKNFTNISAAVTQESPIQFTDSALGN